MNQIIIILFLVLTSISAFGQKENNEVQNLRNTIFIEALGNGLLGSANYERQLSKNPHLTARVGIGFHAESNFYLTIPISLQYFFDLKKNNFIEAGIGYTWAQFGADDCFYCDGTDNTDDYSNLYLSIGYRKHFGNKWMWKVNFSPLITNNHGEIFRPWIGASFGKKF